MKGLLPKVNYKWYGKSFYTFQPYFVEQKARTRGSDEKAVKVIGLEK